MSRTVSPPFADDEIVVAKTSFARGNDVILVGERRRAGERVVLETPTMWVRDGEFGLANDIIAEAGPEDFAAVAEYRRSCEKNKLKLTVAPAIVYIATRNVYCHRDGRPALILKGSRVAEGDELLAAEPDAWVEAK